MEKMREVEIEGQQPIKELLAVAEEQDMKEQILLECAKNNQNEKYAATQDNLLNCWAKLLLFIVLFSCLAVGALEYVDRDKR